LRSLQLGSNKPHRGTHTLHNIPHHQGRQDRTCRANTAFLASTALQQYGLNGEKIVPAASAFPAVLFCVSHLHRASLDHTVLHIHLYRFRNHTVTISVSLMLLLPIAHRERIPIRCGDTQALPHRRHLSVISCLTYRPHDVETGARAIDLTPACITLQPSCIQAERGEKEQTLACLFCRGRPPLGSSGSTCKCVLFGLYVHLFCRRIFFLANVISTVSTHRSVDAGNISVSRRAVHPPGARCAVLDVR